MLRLKGVKANAKVRLPERGHIETSMMDGTILPLWLQIHPQQQVLEARGVAEGVQDKYCGLLGVFAFSVLV